MCVQLIGILEFHHKSQTQTEIWNIMGLNQEQHDTCNLFYVYFIFLDHEAV
jgi:hypothetical protein